MAIIVKVQLVMHAHVKVHSNSLYSVQNIKITVYIVYR